MHALFTLAKEHKWRKPEKIDEFVRAYVDPDDDKELKDLVERYMLHGPCGRSHPQVGSTVSIICYQLEYILFSLHVWWTRMGN
jgi:hypothetical protein